MLLRKVALEDRDAIGVLVKNFGREYDLPFKLDMDNYVGPMIERAFIHDDVFFYVVEEEGVVVGFLAGLLSTSNAFNLKLAHELGWYIAPEHRGSAAGTLLISRFEDWAIEVGAYYVTMSYNPSLNKELSVFYERNGYIQAEVTYVKRLRDE